MSNNNTDAAKEAAEKAAAEKAAKEAAEKEKTTPDEGKTFNEDTAFACVQDCFIGGARYRPGDVKTGRTCPPYFVVKPDAEAGDKKKK